MDEIDQTPKRGVRLLARRDTAFTELPCPQEGRLQLREESEDSEQETTTTANLDRVTNFSKESGINNLSAKCNPCAEPTDQD